MQLDSIIYDANTLSNALSEKLQQESPTFNAMYPSETATSLVNTLSGYGAMLQYTIVSAMANCYADSAYSPSGIYQIAETLGNQLHGKIAAKIKCVLERTTCRGIRAVIPANSVFDVEGISFFNPDPIAFGVTYNKTENALLVQGVVSTTEKVTSGVADEKIYFGNDFVVDPDYIKVFVNNEEWKITNSFISYDTFSVLNTEDLKVVVVRTDPDGRSYVKLGNGLNGLLPVAGSTVRIQYVVNDGERGNILKNNLDIKLKSPLYFNNTLLEVKTISSSTSYGGSEPQSLDVLKASSPYVFASGDRCVRRQDYKAMLLNKCGYSSVNVWGEYEEALVNGTYDKIMMNMVYYTGIKGLQQYEYYTIGSILDSKVFDGSLDTTRAFPGSVSIKVVDIENPENYMIYEDNGGKGLLFNNSDEQFGIDNFYQDYSQGIGSLKLISGGEANSNVITNIIYNSQGSYLNSFYESQQTPALIYPAQIQFDFTDPRSIAGIKFYIPNGDINYQKNAIGAFAVYGTDEALPEDVATLLPEEKAVYYGNVRNNKYWSPVLPFTKLPLGTLGQWTSWNASMLRNSKEGRQIIVSGTTYLRNAMQDTTTSFGWIYSTNVTTTTIYTAKSYPDIGDDAFLDPGLKTSIGKISHILDSQWKSYKHYLLEIYSVQDGSSSSLKLGKVKLLYNESLKEGDLAATPEVSTIDYEDNGAFTLNFSEASLFEKLYKYTPVVKNLTVANQYKVGDVLHHEYLTGRYKYFGGSDASGTTIPSPVIVADGSGYRANDIVYAFLKPDDLTHYLKYKITEVDESGQVLAGYLLADEGDAEYNGDYDTVWYSSATALLRISTNPDSSNIDLTQEEEPSGSGLVLHIESTPTSLDFTVNLISLDPVGRDIVNNNDFTYSISIANQEDFYGKVLLDSREQPLYEVESSALGSGGVIAITTDNALSVQASYYGNKILEDEISSIDQVIINKYNHFTTYIEYKQPQIIQTHITARVHYRENADIVTTKQNIMANVEQLFAITPEYMGQTLKLSEVYNAIRDTEGVDYCIVDYPSGNIIAEPYQLIVLSQLELIDEE